VGRAAALEREMAREQEKEEREENKCLLAISLLTSNGYKAPHIYSLGRLGA
jgi:hypothetical protein